MFFVMLNHPSADIPAIPMVRADADDATDIAFFHSEEDAFAAAESNYLGENYGYEVFELGAGI